MNETMLSNQPQGDIERVVRALSEALTDNMVERLAITGSNAMEIVDRLNDEGTRDAIHDIIDKVTDLHRIGAINTLFEVVALLHASKAALTDSMIERLFAFFEHMVTNVGHEDFATMVDNARQAMDDAVAESAGAESTGGLFSTLGMLSKPETQRSLQFLLSFSANLQRRASEK